MNKENNNSEAKDIPTVYKNPKYFIKCNNKDGGIGFLAITGLAFRVFSNPTPPVLIFDDKQTAQDMITKNQLNFNKNGTSFEVLDSNEVCALDIQIKPFQPIYLFTTCKTRLVTGFAAARKRATTLKTLKRISACGQMKLEQKKAATKYSRNLRVCRFR
jgi:hypothetical protein